MFIDDFKGYKNGADKTKIGVEYLTSPSKNVFINKGKVYTRGGLTNDGTTKTADNGIHSEFVWKDSLGGERPIRIFEQTVQAKYDDKWLTIYTGLDSDTTRCYFATFVDINTSIVKKRLIIADGSTALYTWNGAIGEVESATTTTAVFATADGNCLRHGFDDGSGTNQTLLHFIGSNTTANSEETQTNDPTAQTLTISGTWDNTPNAGDLIVAKPVKFADEIGSSFDIDVVYSYKNHIVATNFDTTNIYFSHLSTYTLASGLDFTIPIAGNRTASTPILLRLDGNFTAMESRKNKLWISDNSDWYKITKTASQNEYDLWVDVEKFETGENKGALPMAVAKYKGDAIYLAQDNTLQRITSNEILGVDKVDTLSDDVEGLLDGLDTTDVKVYYLERAIYILYPNESKFIMLDMIEGHFQPPQTIPANCISVISGTKYGHHSAENSTFELFTSDNDDLGSDIEAIVAFGLYKGDHPLLYKQHTRLGLDFRFNASTEIEVSQKFEEEAAKAEDVITLKKEDLKTFITEEDLSWGTHPYGSRSLGGADMDTVDVLRCIAFVKYDAVSWFNYTPKLTISGKGNEFYLLGWWIDDEMSERQIADEHYITR